MQHGRPVPGEVAQQGGRRGRVRVEDVQARTGEQGAEQLGRRAVQGVSGDQRHPVLGGEAQPPGEGERLREHLPVGLRVAVRQDAGGRPGRVLRRERRARGVAPGVVAGDREHRQPLGRALGRPGVGGVGEEQRRCGGGEDGRLRLGLLRVQRDVRGAGLEHRQHGGDRRDVVAAPERDPVAGAGGGPDPGRQRVGDGVQFAVGPPARGAVHGEPVAEPGGGRAEPADRGLVGGGRDVVRRLPAGVCGLLPRHCCAPVGQVGSGGSSGSSGSSGQAARPARAAQAAQAGMNSSPSRSLTSQASSRSAATVQ